MIIEYKFIGTIGCYTHFTPPKDNHPIQSRPLISQRCICNIHLSWCFLLHSILSLSLDSVLPLLPLLVSGTSFGYSPRTGYGVLYFSLYLFNQKIYQFFIGWCKYRLLAPIYFKFNFSKGKFVLGVLLYLPGVAIFTPIYIVYVVLTSIYNFIWPEWIQDENEEKTILMFKVTFF